MNSPSNSEIRQRTWKARRSFGLPASFGSCFIPSNELSSGTAPQHSCQISYAGFWGILFRVSFLVQIENTFFSLLLTACRAFPWDSSWNCTLPPSSPKIARNPRFPSVEKARHVAVSWQQAPRRLWCSKQYVGCILGERMCWGKWSEKYCCSPFPL